MQRVKLANLALGDPDDVAIYAAAASWDWMQTDAFKQLEKYGIVEQELYWTNGKMLPHAITIDIWADVDDNTAILLKLSGLCQLK